MTVRHGAISKVISPSSYEGKKGSTGKGRRSRGTPDPSKPIKREIRKSQVGGVGGGGEPTDHREPSLQR